VDASLPLRAIGQLTSKEAQAMNQMTLDEAQVNQVIPQEAQVHQSDDTCHRQCYSSPPPAF
jgi:hypothetical protein